MDGIVEEMKLGTWHGLDPNGAPGLGARHDNGEGGVLRDMINLLVYI